MSHSGLISGCVLGESPIKWTCFFVLLPDGRECVKFSPGPRRDRQHWALTGRKMRQIFRRQCADDTLIDWFEGGQQIAARREDEMCFVFIRERPREELGISYCQRQSNVRYDMTECGSLETVNHLFHFFKSGGASLLSTIVLKQSVCVSHPLLLFPNLCCKE